jgi:hypothetical protein
MHADAPWRSLALPFQPAPLLLVATVSLLLGLALKAGVFGIPMIAILVSWFFKYCFMLLDHAAEGRPGAPVLTPEAANPVGEMRPLAYVLLIATFYFATRALGQATDVSIASGLRLAALGVLPAIVAVHAMTGSWSEALNPRTCAVTIRRLGWGYVWIVAVAAACWWLGRAIVVDAMGLSMLLRTAMLMLVWLMLFSIIGGTLHARRAELGFEPEHSPERDQRRHDRERDRERDRFVDQIFAEFRSGNPHNAWSSIERHARQGTDALGEYLWIYDRVARWPRPGARLANQLAQELLPALLGARRNGEALRIARDRIGADAEFRPRSGSDVLKIAQLARDGGDRPLARALLQDFEQRFPDDAARMAARKLLDQIAR